MSNRCKTCQFEFEGKFCNECGQPVIDGFTAPYLIQLVSQDLFDVDRGLWRTFRELMLRPGKMIGEYLDGKTKEYFSPLKYLLLAVALLYLLMSLTETFSSTEVHDNEDWKKEYFYNDHKAFTPPTVTDSMLAGIYLVKKNLSVYYLILLPFLGLTSSVLFKKFSVIENLIIWTFIWGHILWVMAICFVPVTLVATRVAEESPLAMTITVLSLLVQLIFITYTYKQLTHHSWAKTFFKSVGSVYAAFLLLFIIVILVFNIFKLCMQA